MYTLPNTYNIKYHIIKFDRKFKKKNNLNSLSFNIENNKTFLNMGTTISIK